MLKQLKPQTQWSNLKKENQKEEQKVRGLPPKRSSPTFQQIFKEVSLNEKIKDWSETQSRNQQLGENEQSRKEYVWLFWVQLMGEKRSLNLSVVRSLTVTLALASSTIVLPEVFPFGRSKENNCFHHLLFQFQDSDSTPAVSTPYFTSMVHLTFSPSPIPQPFPLFWGFRTAYTKQYLAPIHSFFYSVTFLSYRTQNSCTSLTWQTQKPYENIGTVKF